MSIMKDQVREYKIDDCIYFNSKGGEKILSNMYPCKLVYDGVVYHSVEQMFHSLLYKKLQEKTMQCKNALDCKKLYNTYVLGKKDTKGQNETKEDVEKRELERLMDKYRIIHLCHQVKFQQFKPFREIIINSGDKDIVEYCYWIYDKSIDTFGTYKDDEKGLFVGINICGRSMMACREECREGILKV